MMSCPLQPAVPCGNCEELNTPKEEVPIGDDMEFPDPFDEVLGG